MIGLSSVVDGLLSFAGALVGSFAAMMFLLNKKTEKQEPRVEIKKDTPSRATVLPDWERRREA